MNHIYLIRHGQTTWNVDGRWQGNLDIPLSETGYQQAQALAHYLSHKPIRRVISSDLARAVETARPLARALGVELELDPRIREIHLGVFQGLTHAEQRERYPEVVAASEQDYWNFVFPEGESRRKMQQRAVAAFQDALARPVEGDIAMVMHGGTLRVLLMHLFPDHPSLLDFHVGNTSITTIEAAGNDLKLVSLTQIPHLRQSADYDSL